MDGLIEGAGIRNASELKEGNKYKLIYQAYGHDDLGVFTYTGKDSVTYPTVKYIFKKTDEKGNPVVYSLSANELTTMYEVEIVMSGGKRKSRRAAKKTRRNRRRSSRNRKA
jgi:hypothetical protein